MSRRRNRNPSNSDSIKTPADIDRLVADMDRMHVCKEMKKFLVYINERKVYRHDTNSRDYLNLCLSSYFVLNKISYEKVCGGLQLMPLEELGPKTAKLLSFRPGLHKEVLQLLELKTESHPKQSRVVCMTLDECAITPGVINIDGRPYGIVDDGVTQTETPAKFVTYIWIASLGGTWVNPLAYYFNSQPAKPSQLKSQIFECITKLKEIDLDVVVLNTKLRLNFLELSELLGVGPDKQTFKVGEKEVVFIFDAPHLMTVTRNNLMKYSLRMEDGGQTSWKHIKTFFVKESESGEKKTKLTETHIKPNKYDRALPSLAIEVLSNSVASGMQGYVESGKIPAEALATAECITLFDRLFDMLNANYEVSINEFANAYTATKRQKQYLEKVMQFLGILKVFDNKGAEKTSEVKFIKAWLTTIRGTMKLWEIVKNKNHQFLLTGNITSGPLDKFINLCRFKLIFIRDPTPSELFEKYLDVFLRFYFTFETPSTLTAISMGRYAELVYKRIPAVRHSLGNTTQPRMMHISAQEFIAVIMEQMMHQLW